MRGPPRSTRTNTLMPNTTLFGSADPLVAPIAAQLDHATALPKIPEWERIMTEMQIVAERMVRGAYSVDEAAREIDLRADRLLEKRRGMLDRRSEEHTSELQSLMRISYAVFCLKKQKPRTTTKRSHT